MGPTSYSRGLECNGNCNRPHQDLDDEAMQQFIKHPVATNLAAKDAEAKATLEALTKS